MKQSSSDNVGAAGVEPLSLVVTGASSGIGHAISTLALEKGWSVFGSVRTEMEARRLSEEFGDRFTPLIFDVRDQGEIAHAAKVVHEAIGNRTLNGLINNAGLAYPGPMLHQSLEEVRSVIETNILGPFLVTRAFAPLLGADQHLSGKKGRIINMSSIAGKIGQPFASAYVASKHALEGLSEVMRRELVLYGIGVIIIAPATVDTPIWDEGERAIGKYSETDYGHAFDKGVRGIVDFGHKHGLAARNVAEIVLKALTARKPRLRYAPAQHALLEQALPRVSPRRVTDFAIEHDLGLTPGRPLVGVKA